MPSIGVQTYSHSSLMAARLASVILTMASALMSFCCRISMSLLEVLEAWLDEATGAMGAICC